MDTLSVKLVLVLLLVVCVGGAAPVVTVGVIRHSFRYRD